MGSPNEINSFLNTFDMEHLNNSFNAQLSRENARLLRAMERGNLTITLPTVPPTCQGRQEHLDRVHHQLDNPFEVSFRRDEAGNLILDVSRNHAESSARGTKRSAEKAPDSPEGKQAKKWPTIRNAAEFIQLLDSCLNSKSAAGLQHCTHLLSEALEKSGENHPWKAAVSVEEIAKNVRIFDEHFETAISQLPVLDEESIAKLKQTHQAVKELYERFPWISQNLIEVCKKTKMNFRRQFQRILTNLPKLSGLEYLTLPSEKVLKEHAAVYAPLLLFTHLTLLPEHITNDLVKPFHSLELFLLRHTHTVKKISLTCLTPEGKWIENLYLPGAQGPQIASSRIGYVNELLHLLKNTSIHLHLDVLLDQWYHNYHEFQNLEHLTSLEVEIINDTLTQRPLDHLLDALTRQTPKLHSLELRGNCWLGDHLGGYLAKLPELKTLKLIDFHSIFEEDHSHDQVYAQLEEVTLTSENYIQSMHFPSKIFPNVKNLVISTKCMNNEETLEDYLTLPHLQEIVIENYVGAEFSKNTHVSKSLKKITLKPDCERSTLNIDAFKIAHPDIDFIIE